MTGKVLPDLTFSDLNEPKRTPRYNSSGGNQMPRVLTSKVVTELLDCLGSLTGGWSSCFNICLGGKQTEALHCVDMRVLGDSRF